MTIQRQPRLSWAKSAEPAPSSIPKLISNLYKKLPFLWNQAG